MKNEDLPPQKIIEIKILREKEFLNEGTQG